MSDLILPPAGTAKPFAVAAATLRKIALGFSLYLILVMYPAYALLRHSWGHAPTSTEMFGAVLFAGCYGLYAFNEMKKLTLISSGDRKNDSD